MNSLCDNCKKNEGQGRQCEGDGRWHHHGMVHVQTGGLEWLCDGCGDKAAKAWQEARLPRIVEAKDGSFDVYI